MSLRFEVCFVLSLRNLEFDGIFKYLIIFLQTAKSEREKLEIAKHFLTSSPPGQFNEIMTGSYGRNLPLRKYCVQSCIEISFYRLPSFPGSN